MTRFLSISLLCLIMTACVPQGASLDDNVHPRTLAGDWQDEKGTHFSLDADGQLGMPGQTARSGLDWTVRGEVLVLRTLDLPGGTPREDRLGIVSASSSRLVLRSPSGTESQWRKSRDAVKRLDGTLAYRERMALPPQVVVSAQLFLPNSDVSFASSLAYAQGQVPVPFRIHYLAKDAENASVQLRAALMHENDALFATAEPVSVSLDSEISPAVVLQRSLPGEADPAPLMVPAQFKGKRQNKQNSTEFTLYLEPDGLYLLNQSKDGKETLTGGSWKQIDRNHTLQLAQASGSPLSASLRPAGSLLLTTPAAPGGEVELKPIVAALPQTPFRIRGIFHMNKGQALLRECTTGLEYAIKTSSQAYDTLKAAWDKGKSEDGLLVEVEGVLRYRNGAPAPTTDVHSPRKGEQDAHLLEIAQFMGAYPGQTCDKPYALASLENTYWRLISVKGQAAQTFPDQTEPHLILRSKKEAAGSDGCNNFFMQWQSKGSEISFKAGGSTLMLCPQGEEQSRQMLDSLTKANSWQITGSVLELRQDAKPVATFEAVAL